MNTRRNTRRSTTVGTRLGRLGSFTGFRLRRLQNQLARDFSIAAKRQQPRSGLFSALALIEANPGLSQREMATEIGLDKSPTVLIVDELESRGLAVRRPAESDRRRHALHITPAGVRWLDQTCLIMQKTESAALQALSPRELRQLHRLLDRMYAACNAEVTP
jgi:DNA-binding MarR family transcriptional regulator